ncbi:MAG: polysaccharide deacetylase family protein [bacterium]
MTNKKEFNIIMYHRIIDSLNGDSCSPSYHHADIVVNLEKFVRQIKHLHSNHHIIGLDKAVDAYKNKHQMPDKACVLTFDDGFVDVYKNVFPVLKYFGLTATFFIMGNPTLKKEPRWLDWYYFLIDNSTLSEFSFQWREFHLKGAKTQSRESLYPLKLFLSASPATEQSEILAELEKTLKVHCDWDELNDSLYISKENIIEMSRAGMSFGAHTITHPNLSKINLKEAQEEILSSVKLTRQLTGSDFMSFAYPFGGKTTYDEKIINILKESNVACACTSNIGVNSCDTSLFELKRIPGEHIDEYIK